jgi:hypothetical protein
MKHVSLAIALGMGGVAAMSACGSSDTAPDRVEIGGDGGAFADGGGAPDGAPGGDG